MWKSVRHYALEIYTVLALLWVAGAVMAGELSVIQQLVLIDTVLFVLHEWEEARFPGGFIEMGVQRMHLEVSAEFLHDCRLPAGFFLLLLSILPFVFDEVKMLTMALATFGLAEGLVHTVAIRLFRVKRCYTPGLVTAWLETAVSVLLTVYLATNHLGRWYDYVFGPLITLACFGLFQRIMTRLMGVPYRDMPKYLKRLFTRTSA